VERLKSRADRADGDHQGGQEPTGPRGDHDNDRGRDQRGATGSEEQADREQRDWDGVHQPSPKAEGDRDDERCADAQGACPKARERPERAERLADFERCVLAGAWRVLPVDAAGRVAHLDLPRAVAGDDHADDDNDRQRPVDIWTSREFAANEELEQRNRHEHQIGVSGRDSTTGRVADLGTR
jgi:hypothetical protein